jgi:hypothetical protein
LVALPLGFYTYFKRLATGAARPTTVEVYLLHVEGQLKKWPEKHERKQSWLSIDEAIDRVEEPGAVPLLKRLMEFGGALEDAIEPSAERAVRRDNSR